MGIRGGTPKHKGDAYWSTRNKYSFGALIRNVLITTPSTLTLMLTMSYSAIKAATGVWGLAPGKNFTITFPTMPKNAALQTSFASFNLCIIFDIERHKISSFQDSKLWGARASKIVEMRAVPPYATHWFRGWCAKHWNSKVFIGEEYSESFDTGIVKC